MMKCKNCKMPIRPDIPYCPNCGAPNPPKDHRKLLIVILIILCATAATLIGFLVVLLIGGMSPSKPNVPKFDFTCSEYTDEMNRILGVNKLNKDNWNVSDTAASYTEIDFAIDPDLDEESQKITKISVGPTDNETAAKMAAASVMAVEPDVSQKEALTQLADLSEEKTEKYEHGTTVVIILKEKKRFEIKPIEDAVIPATAEITQSAEPSAITGAPVSEPTEAPTEKPTEAPTAEPATEAPQDNAHNAYLEYLENNRSEFVNDKSEYYRKREANNIAFTDLNGDGVDEFVCVRYGDNQYMRINFTIFSYRNGEMITLYDDMIYALAGAEGTHEIFIGSDAKVYSVVNHFPTFSVTEYEIGETGVSANQLANRTGRGTDDPNPEHFIGGSSVSKSEFDSFVDSTRDKAETVLCYSHNASASAGSISMSYDAACTYLKQ